MKIQNATTNRKVLNLEAVPVRSNFCIRSARECAFKHCQSTRMKISILNEYKCKKHMPRIKRVNPERRNIKETTQIMYKRDSLYLAEKDSIIWKTQKNDRNRAKLIDSSQLPTLGGWRWNEKRKCV